MTKQIKYINHALLPLVKPARKSEIFDSRIMKLTKTNLFSSLITLEPIAYINTELLSRNKDLYYNNYVKPFILKRGLSLDKIEFDKITDDLLNNPKCICSQKIKKVYLVYNRIDNTIFTVGSSCVKKWVDRAKKEIEEDIDKEKKKQLKEKSDGFSRIKNNFLCIICFNFLSFYETKDSELINPVCKKCFKEYEEIKNYNIKSGKYKGTKLFEMFQTKEKTNYLNFLFKLRDKSELVDENLGELLTLSLKYSVLKKKIKYKKGFK